MIRLKFHRTPQQIREAFKAAARDETYLLWVVYHGNHRMTARPFGLGFQPTPCTCPRCKKYVSEPDELRYELASMAFVRVRTAATHVQRTNGGA